MLASWLQFIKVKVIATTLYPLPEALVATIHLNRQGFASVCEQAGLDTYKSLARRINVDLATVSRVMSGKANPGVRFIAGSVAAFGSARFPDLFSVTNR